MKPIKKIKDEVRQEYLKNCREALPTLNKNLNHNDRLIVRTRNILDDLLKEKKNLLVKIDACQSTLSKEDKKWL